MIYYVKLDSNNEFPDKDTVPALEPAEGLVAVDIPKMNKSAQYFTLYWWMYRLLDNGRVEAPGNLPSLENDYLEKLIEEQDKTIEEQKATIESLKDIAAQLGGAQAMASVDLEDVKTATSELGGQLAEMMVAKTTAAE